ncbi:hypothetical protein MMC13_004571 [Lambiella insularis]|nr:hypothetical protein [Lambiella insularis]
MYTTSHPVSASMNGMGADMIDGSGTINPAALNTPGITTLHLSSLSGARPLLCSPLLPTFCAYTTDTPSDSLPLLPWDCKLTRSRFSPVSVLPASTSINASNASPRGIKRSRSPDIYGNLPVGGQDDDDDKPRKRGRPPKTRLSGSGLPDSPTQSPDQITHPTPQQLQTPQLQTQGLPQQTSVTPTQTSPPKVTPTKTVVKALPTVRDHTTDQLNAEADEYIPREYDEAGEKKVSPTGRALEGREYKCRTFLVPNRGDKLFMLATECARVLGYRDSYLLFNKNRSLFKIIATQPEKDDLIHQEILPYSYRSRQIAIVTAKSMFRQFGSRVINNGRRVRDDYWEAKARKQGFTEEDLAGEKRPGGAKAAREAEMAQQAATVAALGQNQVVYSNGPENIPVNHGLPQHMQPGLPMIVSPLRDYGDIPRPPRQELTGTPYQDRTQPSSATDIMGQATNAGEYNKFFMQNRAPRSRMLEEAWRQTPKVPVSSPQQGTEVSPAITQSSQSPQLVTSNMINTGQQPMLQHHNSQVMNPSSYSQQPHQQTHLAQSSRTTHQPMRPDQLQRPPSNLSYPPASVQQSSPYGTYPQQSQMWGQPPPQPQQSPVTSHHSSMPQYSQQHHHSSQSPHPSQSPQQHAPHPQLQQPQSSSSMQGAGMGYQGMSMAQTGYGGMAVPRNAMYPQTGSASHAYMQGQTTAGTAGGLQGWAPPPHGQAHTGQQQWSGY